MALRIETMLAVLVFALCVAITVAPVTMTNFILRYRAAEEGDLYFELAYRLIAMVGGAIALYILVGDLWKLAHLSR